MCTCVPYGYRVLCWCLGSKNHWIIKSQNGLGWKGPQSPPSPTPCWGQGCPSPAQLPRAPSNLALSASRGGAPQLLWVAVPAPHHSLSKDFFPNVSPEFLLFQIKIVPLCPITVTLCKKLVPLLLVSSLHILDQQIRRIFHPSSGLKLDFCSRFPFLIHILVLLVTKVFFYLSQIYPHVWKCLTKYKRYPR